MLFAVRVSMIALIVGVSVSGCSTSGSSSPSSGAPPAANNPAMAFASEADALRAALRDLPLTKTPIVITSDRQAAVAGAVFLDQCEAHYQIVRAEVRRGNEHLNEDVAALEAVSRAGQKTLHAYVARKGGQHKDGKPAGAPTPSELEAACSGYVTACKGFQDYLSRHTYNFLQNAAAAHYRAAPVRGKLSQTPDEARAELQKEFPKLK